MFAFALHFLVKPEFHKFPLFISKHYGVNKSKGSFKIPEKVVLSLLMISTILPILLAFGVWSIMTSSDGKSIDLEIDQRLRVFCPSIDNFYTNAFYNKGLL